MLLLIIINNNNLNWNLFNFSLISYEFSDEIVVHRAIGSADTCWGLWRWHHHRRYRAAVERWNIRESRVSRSFLKLCITRYKRPQADAVRVQPRRLRKQEKRKAASNFTGGSNQPPWFARESEEDSSVREPGYARTGGLHYRYYEASIKKSHKIKQNPRAPDKPYQPCRTPLLRYYTSFLCAFADTS